jgi:hypothetical protein
LVIKEQELGVVQKEQSFIKKKEEETERVIAHLEKTVTQKPAESAPAKPPVESPSAEAPISNSASKEQKRMFVLERRKTQLRKN